MLERINDVYSRGVELKKLDQKRGKNTKKIRKNY